MTSDTTVTELGSEKFEWFGPSPIEPFNFEICSLAPDMDSVPDPDGALVPWISTKSALARSARRWPLLF